MNAERPADEENPFAGQGAVMLDIGGDVGAIVVTMPAALLGSEIEIRRADDPALADVRLHVVDHDHGHDRDHGHGHGHPHGHSFGEGQPPHVAVLARPVPGQEPVPSLVYPDVVEGRYVLCPKGTLDVAMSLTVVGGEVTTVSWPVCAR